MELHALHHCPAGVLLVGILHAHSLQHMGRQHAAPAQQRVSAAQQLLCHILFIPAHTKVECAQDALAQQLVRDLSNGLHTTLGSQWVPLAQQLLRDSFCMPAYTGVEH